MNRVYDMVESTETASKLICTAERFLHMELKSLGFVFDDASMMKAVRRQVPLLAAYPDSLAAKCVEAQANSLLSGRPQQVKLGWQGFLRKFFHNMH